MCAWWTKKREIERTNDTRLTPVVAEHMPGADSTTIRIVAAVAGLLAHVAYADHHYDESEERHVRARLGEIDGLGDAGIEALAREIRTHIAHIATVEAPRHLRVLRDEGARDLRMRVLDMLVDVAAADERIVAAETNALRHLTTALGLTQDDYNASQTRHRDKLVVLR